MKIDIQVDLYYAAPRPCDLLLQIEVAQYAGQAVLHDALSVTGNRVSGEGGIGRRLWMTAAAEFVAGYQAQVEITRPTVDLAGLAAVPLTAIPADVVTYLMPSRYCFPEDFFDFTARSFGNLSDGALVAAMSDWVCDNYTYDVFATNPGTTATQSFAARRGVCRDYAHTLIAMLRAVGIPARIVSAYGPHVSPQDFHAVVEVYLDHAWHLVDPTGMAKADSLAVVGIGRDAADISFMTSYGLMEMKKQTVDVSEI